MSSPMTLTLDEALKEMLRGVVMVDKYGSLHRAFVLHEGKFTRLRRWIGHDFYAESTFYVDGWRHATPEELAEIEIK